MIKQEIINKIVNNRINEVKHYQYRNAEITYTIDNVAYDRYNQEIKTGDIVDVCKSSPGGLVTGKIAIILTISYSEYDNEVYSYDNVKHKYITEVKRFPPGSFTEIWIYTTGKRWTKKCKNEIIKIPTINNI